MVSSGGSLEEDGVEQALLTVEAFLFAVFEDRNLLPRRKLGLSNTASRSIPLAGRHGEVVYLSMLPQSTSEAGGRGPQKSPYKIGNRSKMASSG